MVMLGYMKTCSHNPELIFPRGNLEYGSAQLVSFINFVDNQYLMIIDN
jgi:hypothetical protein